MLIRSRRDFIKTAAGAVGSIGAMGKFGEMNALASTTAPYQALVCIFLAGGNDSNNMVIPVATAQQNYSLYAQGRQGLAIPQGSLLADQERQRHLRPAPDHAGDPGAL